MTILVILALIGTLFASHAAAQPAVITRVSGCTDLGNITTDCVPPVVLTLYGSGFLTNLEDDKYPSTRLMVRVNQSAISYRLSADSPLNDTYLECTIHNEYYPLSTGNTLLNVQLTNAITRETVSFLGVSFRSLPVPRVDRVSGCANRSDDGQTVYGCHPDEDSLTLHGSGFAALAGSRNMLYIGNFTSDELLIPVPISDGVDTRSLTFLNDSVMVFTLGNNRRWLLPIPQSRTSPIPFYIRAYYSLQWTSATVYFAYGVLPPPMVLSASEVTRDNRCFTKNGNTFTGCYNGVAELTLTGKHFDDITVTVGGRPAMLRYVRPDNVDFYLPRYSFPVNQSLDLVVSNVAGSFTLPDFVSVNDLPTISLVWVCGDARAAQAAPSSFVSVNCLSTENLTMTVYNFASVSATAPIIEVSVSYNHSNVLARSLPCHYIDANTLTCLIPAGAATLTSPIVHMQAVWPDTGTSSTYSAVNGLWYDDNAPRITTVEGCIRTAGMGATEMDQCLGNDVITIRGERMLNATYNTSVFVSTSPSSGATQCANVVVVDVSTVTCELPLIDTDPVLTWDTDYFLFVQLAAADTASMLSNVAYVRFVEEITNGGQSGSTGSNSGASSSVTSASTIALATVFSVVGAVLLIVGGYMVTHRLRSKLGARGRGDVSIGGSVGSASEFSIPATSSRHVELQEY